MERKYYLRGLGLGIAMTAIIMGVALSGNKTMTDEEIIARAKELGMVENTVLSDTGDESTEADMDDDGVGMQNAEQQNSERTEQDPPMRTEEDNVSDAEADVEADTGGSADSGTDVEAPVNTVSSEGTDQTEVDADKEADADDGDTDDIASVTDEKKPSSTQQERDNDKPKENVNEIITSAAVKTITVNSGDGSYKVARKLADVGVVTSAETFDTFLCQNGYDKRLRTGTFSIPADASDEQIARIVTGAE